MFLNLALITVFRRAIKRLSLHAIRKILLSDVMVRIVMCILISIPMTERLSSLVMSVPQVNRNRHCVLIFTASIASSIAQIAELLFGAVAT